MKKNGFTLVELLAVIVILGIIMTIVGTNLMSVKKEANIKEAKKIEQTIEDLGPEVYYDIINNKNGLQEGNEFAVDNVNEYLSKYLKSSTIKNPAGGDDCKASLSININTNEGPSFSANLCCPGLYKTGETDYKGDCKEQSQ